MAEQHAGDPARARRVRRAPDIEAVLAREQLNVVVANRNAEANGSLGSTAH